MLLHGAAACILSANAAAYFAAAYAAAVEVAAAPTYTKKKFVFRLVVSSP